MIKFFLTCSLCIFSILIPVKADAETISYISEIPEAIQDVGENLKECLTEEPEVVEYKGKFIGSFYKGKLQPGEPFSIKIYILNTGTVTWFGDESLCQKENLFRLGSSKKQDRVSMLWSNLMNYQQEVGTKTKDHSWLSGNRIKMNQSVVPPGQVATFEFKAIAPIKDDIYMEYFTPLLEGITWLEDADIAIQLNVGEIDASHREKVPFMTFSTFSDILNLDEKNIVIDISDQKMYVKIGESVIYTFPVSSGKAATPTPIEKTQIYFKQWVRVAHKAPHYIMPRYHSLRSSGMYGIHALPSLGNDGGVFWREALNHIGERRSHGCIRVLPEDADTLWNFSEQGTPVEIVW